uniref:Reverse transcriptase n=2 Tax=Anolis carolinensis TaxID=28377 RepID=A0A803TV28_ANOCA
MFMFPTVKVPGDTTESLVCSFRSGCGELTLSQEYGHHPAVAVRCNMQVEDEELLGAGGGRSERATPETDAEFHQLAALASSTAYAQPNGVTQRRGVVRGDSTGGEEGSPSPGPQKMVFLEERMSAMETTLAVMSRAMERLAVLAEPERGRELRASSMWDVSMGSSQGFADLPAPKGREMRKEPGARPKIQTSLTRVEESDDEGEKPPRIPATLPTETLVPLANAGRGTGQREAAAGPTGPQGGLRRAENWGLPPQGPLPRREELRIEFGGESSELDFFLTTVRGYMEDNAHTFRTESSRVRAIGAVLKRGAASWYVQLHARRDPCLGSLRRFMGALETRFRDPLEQIRAREELKTVSQGQRSVSEYAEEFQCLAEKVPEWSAVTKIELFKEGLRREILSWAVHRDEPDTLRGWIQLAGRIETSLAQARRHRGGLQQRPQMKEGSRKEGSTPAGRRTEPTGNVSTSRRGCFVCGRLGHRAAECWQRKGEGGGPPKPRAVAGKRAEEEPPMRHHSGGLVSQDKAMIVVPIQLESGSKQATCKAFVDCGCSRNIISPELAEGLGCERTNLESPIAFSQLDGSTASGSLAKYSAEDVKCKIGSWEGKVSFVISQIASYNVILGMPWLGQANPQINWEDKSMIFRMKLEGECQEAFEALKKRFTEEPVLQHPDMSKAFVLHCDASDRAYGAVLLQKDEGGNLKPCGYLSKKFSDTEKNWPIWEREALAILKALECWRHFLEGSGTPFEVWTDHRNLQYLRSPRKLSAKQIRWAQYFSRFDFRLRFFQGKHNILADALSRMPQHGGGIQESEGSIFLDKQWGLAVLTRAQAAKENKRTAISTGGGEIWEEELKRAYGMDKWLLTNKEKGELCGDLVFVNKKLYIPECLRREMLRKYHDNKGAGHLGPTRTIKLLAKQCWWPGMRKDAWGYVTQCELCAEGKTPPGKPQGLLQKVVEPMRPWECVAMDFVGELPPSRGHRYIWTILDLFSKQAHFVALPKLPSAEKLADLYVKHVYRLHGCPDKIISDRGVQFTAKFWGKFLQLLGAERNLSSAFHPATNGGVERTQQTLCQFLRMYTNYRQDDWADLLPFAEMAFNGAVHSATGRAPFEIVYGQEVAPFPRLPEWKEGEGQTDEEWPAKIKQGWQTVVEALRETQKKYKLFADRRRREGDKLGEGDLVWLSTKNLKLGFPSKKLAPRYIGPFRVAKRINEVTYELRLPKDLGKVHPVFHCSLLKKYKGTLDSGEQ